MGILKKTGLLAQCFILLTGCYSQGPGNSIDANIPEKLAAYSTHTIEITIKKGPSSTFSKYELHCPPNVTVKEGVSKDGNFSFINQVAKYVWVESPKTDEFNVTMILQVGNASGQAMFEHHYYYIEGESRKEIADGPMHVEFTPGTPQDKTQAITKTTDTVKSSTQTSVPSTSAIATTSTAANKPEEPKKTNITITPSGTTNVSATSNNSVTSTTQPNSSNTTPQKVDIKEYKVQIGSFDTKPSLAKYSNLGKLTVVEENGKFKLVVGGYATKEEAVKKMEELKAQGHQGFVVLFVNGVKAK